MSDESLSELYDHCRVPLRLFRFTKKAYDKLITDVPPQVHIKTDENIYLYQSLHRALESELTAEDAYNLCALVAALEDERGGNLW